MNLLLVSDYGWPAGGVEQFVFEFLRRASEKHECHLLTWEATAKVPAGFTGLHTVKFGDARQAWAVMARADLIIVVTSFNVRLLARLAGEYLAGGDTPALTVVQTSEHSDPFSPAVTTQDRWLRSLVASSVGVVAVSEEVAAAVHRLCSGSDVNPNVVVIENGARLRAPSVLERGRKRLSFIGRPHPQKGFHLYERLANDLAGAGLEFYANTVSVRPERQYPCITYSLLLNDSELRAFFDCTDLLVAPYLRADGCPLALLEAINCGVPVLGFDSPGVGQLLRRHSQAVIAPTYSALLASTKAWMAGLLTVPGASPGAVPSWDEQIDRYLRLTRRMYTEGA